MDERTENFGNRWKLTLLVVVFLATLVPYLPVLFLVNPLELIFLFVGWTLFFVLRTVSDDGIAVWLQGARQDRPGDLLCLGDACRPPSLCRHQMDTALGSEANRICR
jgi:hypothetical protein